MLLDKTIIIPDLGPVGPESGFHLLETTEDGKFVTGKNGVENIVATGDKKVEFVSFGSHTLAGVLYWNWADNFLGIFDGQLGGWASLSYSVLYNMFYVLPDTLIVALAGLFVLKSKPINSMILDYTTQKTNKN